VPNIQIKNIEDRNQDAKLLHLNTLGMVVNPNDSIPKVSELSSWRQKCHGPNPCLLAANVNVIPGHNCTYQTDVIYERPNAVEEDDDPQSS